MKLAVIIPAYNEATVIKDVLNSLPKRLKSVRQIVPIVVNDNSNDETAVIVQRLGGYCLSHRLNLGAGGATLTGFEAARLFDCDLLVTLDADGQHNPNEMADILQPILNNEADLVIGSRLLGRGNMPASKRLVNNLANLVTYVFAGLWVSDSQSGYKAFSRRAIEKINFESAGYEFCTEIIREARFHGLRIKEVPVQAIYNHYSQKKGQSIFNSLNVIVNLVTHVIFRSPQ